MFLHVILLQYITLSSAGYSIFNLFGNDHSAEEDIEALHARYPRKNIPNTDFVEDVLTCDALALAPHTPFVVIMLFRSSGRFLGMGSIVDKKTIITAGRVVAGSMRNPKSLLVLAGRLNPWWGRNSQVKEASEIFLNDVDLALVILREELVYTKNILPIKIPTGRVETEPELFKKEFDTHWAVFGVRRSSWDIQGDRTSKSTIYFMRTESETTKKPDSDACKACYPDVEFNDTVMTCTFANATYSWGCLGSPTVALTSSNKLLQLAVLIRTTSSAADEFHIHVKLGFFEQWINSHTLVAKMKKG